MGLRAHTAGTLYTECDIMHSLKTADYKIKQMILNSLKPHKISVPQVTQCHNEKEKIIFYKYKSRGSFDRDSKQS